MNLKNIPLDFADKLSIVGERLNNYIASNMGHNIYSVITSIIAPLNFDYRDIENIIKDKLKSFDNYSLRSYTSDKIENAWYNESIISQSIKDEFLKLDNDFVKNIIDGEEWNWRDGEWANEKCEELETKLITLIGARYYNYFYKENRWKLEPLLNQALEDMKKYHYRDYIEGVLKIVDYEVRAYKYGD
ncbi:MAG: hypothetical protein SPI60_00135 [Campylobacter lanienae]|nr:hypothetical protein [Campylobacter lanienae]